MVTGSLKALIPMKCIAQIPIPIAMDARTSQRFLVKKPFFLILSFIERAVKDARNAMTTERNTIEREYSPCKITISSGLLVINIFSKHPLAVFSCWLHGNYIGKRPVYLSDLIGSYSFTFFKIFPNPGCLLYKCITAINIPEW